MDTNQGPSAVHWLGTDAFGEDLLSRLIYGARLSLLGPALIILIATTLGTLLAISAAWFGGLFDQVVSRVADIMFAFPGLILAMLAVAMFGPGLVAPVIALSISYTPYLMRVIRAEAIRQRNLPYIAACYVEGLPARTICRRHLLPNVMPLSLVQATLSFGYALVDLAAVSYLGLGVQPPTPEWGLMVSTGQSSILAGYPEESLYADAMIVLRSSRSISSATDWRASRNGPRMSVLSIDHLSMDLATSGGLRRVIHDVTLDVDEGEAVGSPESPGRESP